MGSMRYNVLIERSTLPEEEKDRIRQLISVGIDTVYMNPDTGEAILLEEYLQMNQRAPVVEIDAGTQKDINKRLDYILSNERL
jgi:DNA-binding LacI/PurR family transcriptional regulator